MIPAATRRLVAERAGHLCEYCRTPAKLSTGSFNVEHIVPSISGGPSTPDNLAYACPGCNGHKHVATTARDPSTGELARLFHPRLDEWADHFALQPNGTIILGLSAIGRATIERLGLNREELINLRELLRDVRAR